ncbi:MAG TPA: HupE/UreJ family protein [Tepidisphaeraceae bacterium]|nr:HupE/UreJ family protein [Tepidisphaeraceae bacterium]
MIDANRLLKRNLTALLAVALVLCWAQSARAHVETGKAAGFANGFKHPWSGWDHILAMIAVGIWGAQLGAPAVWLLPVVFPMVMAFGGFLGLIRIHLPGVEYGIALSAVLLGAMVLGEVRSRRKGFIFFAAALVGAFGLFHGHAHGSEMEEGQSAMLYSIGFVIATGTLHACGIAIGLVHRWPVGRVALRAAGALILVGGLYFVWDAYKGGDEAPQPQTAVSLMQNL